MANQVATAIERASESLRHSDIVIAEQVIDADERINDLQRDIDELCVMLLARQQPVAGDLRNVISALRMAQTLERQGDLARHIAAIARGRYPEPPVPEPVLGLILQMADHAVRASKEVARLISTRDLDLALSRMRGIGRGDPRPRPGGRSHTEPSTPRASSARSPRWTSASCARTSADRPIREES